MVTEKNISIVSKIRKENATLNSVIAAVYNLATEGNDKEARAICTALDITAATTKGHKAKQALRASVLKRIPVIVDGAASVTPATLKKAPGEKNLFFAVVTDWAAAIVAAANNTADDSGNYPQKALSLNAVAWVEDNGVETSNIDRAATRIYVYNAAGNDVTAANTAFIDTYLKKVEAKRVANKAASVTREKVYNEQIELLKVE